MQSWPSYLKPGQTEIDGATICVCPVPYILPSGGQVWKYGGQPVIEHNVDGPRPSSRFTNLAMVAVFLKFELYLHLNLDLNLDSNKLDSGLGLELARGQRSGAPTILLSFHSCLAEGYY